MKIHELKPKAQVFGIKYDSQSLEELNKAMSTLGINARFYKAESGDLFLGQLDRRDESIDSGDWILFDSDNDFLGVYSDQGIAGHWIIED